MKKISRRRMTGTSSLNEISTDQLGKRMGGKRRGGGGRGVITPAPTPFCSRLLERYFKTT